MQQKLIGVIEDTESCFTSMILDTVRCRT